MKNTLLNGMILSFCLYNTYNANITQKYTEENKIKIEKILTIVDSAEAAMIAPNDVVVQKIIDKRLLNKQDILKAMILDLNSDVDPKIATHIAKSVIKSCKKYDLIPELVVSIIMKESSFDPKAKSSAGCLGLMQIYPSVHIEKLKDRKIKKQDLYNISHNIDIGCEILKEYIVKYNNLHLALKKYGGYKGKKKNNNEYVRFIMKTYKKYEV